MLAMRPNNNDAFVGVAGTDTFAYLVGESSSIDHSPTKYRGIFNAHSTLRWLGGRVVSVLDSGAEGPGFKSQPRRCRVTVLGKLFTPIVLLSTKQRNW